MSDELDLRRRRLALKVKMRQRAMQAPAPEPVGPAQPQNTVAGVAGQFGAGSQSGIASALGFPVDAVTGGINGLGQLTGLWEPIQNPVGGSASIESALSPFREGIAEPQTGLERAARRVGQEVGASAGFLPAGLAMTAGRAAPMAVAATDTAAALGGGLAAAGANELAPGNMWADMLASIMGGAGAGALAGRAAGLGATAPTVRSGIDEQRMIARDAYGQVRADQTMIPQDSVDGLNQTLANRMAQERINPRLQPGSSAILDALLVDTRGPMRVEDVENLRRVTQQNLPVTATPADQRLSGIMTDEITQYLDGLDMPSANVLREGRQATRRYKAAETVEGATTKAQRRAASTGSGGNEINATRQNIRALLDNPRKSRGFRPDEIAAMEEIVRGTGGGNVLRSLSRFAPTSGGLSSMMGIGGVMASAPVALPIIAATEGAKYLGERSVRNSADNLMELLAPSRVTSPGDPGLMGVIQALLAGRAIANDE